MKSDSCVINAHDYQKYIEREREREKERDHEVYTKEATVVI